MMPDEPISAMKRHRRQSLSMLAVLALVMAATRYQHFGDALHLPDASLAVFFLAGLLVPSVVALPVLLIHAGMIDYLAITVAGVSDYCVSPAYGFLVPTYAVLWYSGRWHTDRQKDSWRGLLQLYLVLWAAISAAFLISNASFFAFSGHFPQMGVAEYATRVARHYPPYALTAFGYVSLAVLMHAALARRRTLPSRPPTASPR